MDAVAALIVLALLAGALLVLGQPLWPGREQRTADRHDLRRADLEAAKLAKYREIRDAELDHATGKLSEADWRAIDQRLRADAVAILHGLDELGEPAGDGDVSTAEGAARPDGAAGRL
ncbi:hypothetical protein [Patulibacter defluvii]|uniref:hypothetical protein n=1 Tax=Patulibacter defluvii TaxID=3095358 RepID=UPI002A761322|nr:hypothetical protein [Patulibacter sp. DM4]